MTTRSRFILAVHRLLLRASGRRLVRVWGLAYRVVARAWAAFLTRGEPGAAAYVRGSIGADDVLPGLSDVDVAVVLAEDPGGPGVARARVTKRWARLRRAFRLTDLLLDYPLVLEDAELARVAGASAFTYGGAAYLGDDLNPDRTRMLDRPGLYGATTDWRRLAGPDRRPPEAVRDAQDRRVAGWLELASWWQWVFPVCADPSGPRTASVCVKLVAEPARVWLWLAHGERAGGRVDVLERALRRLPEEEEGLRRALDLHRALADAPEPPLAEILPVLVRLSARIAALIAAEVADAGATEVRLTGTDPAELLLPYGAWRPTDTLPGGRDPRLLPLCDWRALVAPVVPDQCFAVLPGDPADPRLLAAATTSQAHGPLPALRLGDLMVHPAELSRTEVRAVKCPVTDPVSFALADGAAAAAFPNVRGWSAQDTARRAVAEHAAWLRAAPAPIPGTEPDEFAGSVLARLFTAARAALFLQSIENRAPELTLTVTETTRALGAEDALEDYREFAMHRIPPSPETPASVRALVHELPAYADDPQGAAVS